MQITDKYLRFGETSTRRTLLSITARRRPIRLVFPFQKTPEIPRISSFKGFVTPLTAQMKARKKTKMKKRRTTKRNLNLKRNPLPLPDLPSAAVPLTPNPFQPLQLPRRLLLKRRRRALLRQRKHPRPLRSLREPLQRHPELRPRKLRVIRNGPRRSARAKPPAVTEERYTLCTFDFLSLNVGVQRSAVL